MPTPVAMPEAIEPMRPDIMPPPQEQQLAAVRHAEPRLPGEHCCDEALRKRN